jgi:hypothetical protein
LLVGRKQAGAPAHLHIWHDASQPQYDAATTGGTKGKQLQS